MANLVGIGKHPISGATREIWEGFSWPAFLFGWAWCFFKGMWIAGAIVFAVQLSLALIHPGLGLIAALLSGVILGSFGNEMFANMLLKQGFEPVESESVTPAQEVADSRIARLERLAALKDSGALSDEEYQAEKAKLLD